MTDLFSLLNYSLAQNMRLHKVWLEHFRDASMFTRTWLLVPFPWAIVRKFSLAFETSVHKSVCVCVCLWVLGSVLMYSTYNNRPFLWDKEKAKSNLHIRMCSIQMHKIRKRALSAVGNLLNSVRWLISENYVRQKVEQDTVFTISCPFGNIW